MANEMTLKFNLTSAIILFVSPRNKRLRAEKQRGEIFENQDSLAAALII